MKQNLLTAIDIDINQKSIDTQIEENIITFNKTRLARKIKDIRHKLKLDFPDDVDKHILSKDKIKEITSELITDEESNNFRISQKEILLSKKDNYYTLRQTIQSLNELNEFSAEIERAEIQKIDNLLDYEEVLKHSLNKLLLFHNILKARTEIINTHINSYVNKKLSFNTDSLKLLLNLRDIYKINKSIDDIELYEKYEMESNIDMSQKLSDIYFKKVSNSDNSSNIINDFYQKNNVITRLSKTQIISNKLLAILLSNKFISNNYVTCLKTMYTNNVNNEMIYCTRTLGEILFEITNEDNKPTDKQYKQQIYTSYDGTRPTTEEYYKWNGLQVFDIDLKEWTGSIETLKQKMFEYLQEFNWFLWICKSASGKGIHVYTKVTPPHHVYTDIVKNEYISKYWFKVNYQTKVSIVYDILYRINKDSRSNINFPANFFSEESNYFELTNKIIYNGETKLVGVDNTVGRITSGIRLTYDEFPLINNNFIDAHVGLNLCQTIDGFNYNETIQRVLLRDTPMARKYINIINNDLAIKDVEAMNENKPVEIDLSQFVSLGLDISDVKALPRSAINYQLRYNICNTLASLFGKDGLSMAHVILDSEGCKNIGEINSFYSCAISNGKNPSKYGLDVLKKCGIIKSIEPELKEIVDSGFKNGIKKAIKNSLNNKLIKSKIELGNNEYLSDKKHILCEPLKGGITGSKINIIFSPPGTGKTEFIKTLAKDNKRILLVLPYISVIKNKVETDSEVMELFDCYYGNKDIKQIEYGINAVTTFDKFARANYEKLSKMFDYIFIDESHLLFTSSYRIEATSNVIKKIKELFFISSNDPFAAKLCLLTGTETGESYFFGNVANIIRVNKKSLNKTMEFIICDDILDATTRLANKVFNLLTEGYRILIPTNKGEIYSEKIIGMCEYLLGRSIKYGYYKRSNTEQEICRLINDNNTVGDYEIIFCSNYLSVGVDINDGGKNSTDVKFASIYLGPFSGYEVEQFNARVRKSGIKSIYCVQTEKSDGTTNDLLLEEPNLLLRITEEDRDNFVDDKAIASAKQEFLAQYDPVLHKITTPGFSYINGKIRFNLEEYELTSFETKYNECMQHPVKVARELDKYGYIVSVSDEFNGLEMQQQEELKKIGIEAAKEEKIKKHSLLVGTFIDLIRKNTYINANSLEFTDVIGWIGKHSDLVIENRDLVYPKTGEVCYIDIKFDVFASPISVQVKSKEALDAMFKPAKYLISKYSVTKALDIINLYVDDSGILKQKNFKRAINLLKLVDSSDANELALPMTKVLEKMYEFVDEFEMSKDFKIGYNTYQSTLESWTNQYIENLGITINTRYAYEKVEDGITEMLADIATKTTSKNGMRFSYNKMPDQDSSNVMNRRSVDSMIERMFQITSETMKSNKQSREKHIILQTQNF